MSVETSVNEIISLVEEINAQQHYKSTFISECKRLTDNPRELSAYLKGKTQQEREDYYNRYINELLDRIDNASIRIASAFEDQEESSDESPELSALSAPEPTKKTKKKEKEVFYVGKTTRKKYLKEIGANEEIILRLKKGKKHISRPEEIVDYTVYQTTTYGKLSNAFFRGRTESLTRKHPEFYANLSHALRKADINILSKTYVSMQFFTSFLLFIFALFAGLFVSYTFEMGLVQSLTASAVLAIIAAIVTFTLFYYYPSTVIGSHNRIIKNDLPFVIIHMAAVASSGSKPSSIFKLILSSGEYKGIQSEIKKIVNYVNLFGYDISTALRTVATTTPSARFKDLLNGMVSTIQSGGDLKGYLQQMAEESMNTYTLERKKYVETLSTYSDIYTGVLIAAPLLFIVTLAIINVLGGTIGGFSVKVIALAGTFILLPLLNIMFFLFINIIQPED